MKPTEKQQVTRLARKTTDILDGMDKLVISDDDQLKSASSMLGEIKTISKELNVSKKAITDPLNTALKEVRALFKMPEDNLANAEKIVKAAILAYHEIQDAAAQKEIAKIENRVGEGRGHIRTETAMAKLANVEQPETNLGGAQVKYGSEKIRITDVHKLIAWRPGMLENERVMEALRLELQADFRAGILGDETAGIEVYREKLVAGIAS